MLDKQVQKSFTVICEMLVDRGESLSPEETGPIAIRLPELAVTSSGVFHVDMPGDCGYRIVYSLNSAFKLQDVRKLLAPLSAAPGGPVREVIVVTRELVTSTSRRGLEDAVRRHVQFFCLNELLFNISRHELVPRHEPVRDEKEIERLVAQYRVKSRFHFPIIACTDPMARYLALRPGQLARIVRFSPNVGACVFYRCCAVANTHTTAAVDARFNEVTHMPSAAAVDA